MPFGCVGTTSPPRQLTARRTPFSSRRQSSLPNPSIGCPRRSNTSTVSSPVRVSALTSTRWGDPAGSRTVVTAPPCRSASSAAKPSIRNDVAPIARRCAIPLLWNVLPPLYQLSSRPSHATGGLRNRLTQCESQALSPPGKRRGDRSPTRIQCAPSALQASCMDRRPLGRS